VVALNQHRTWTNWEARSFLSSLHSLPMLLYALKTHIRSTRNVKKSVDLRRNHRSRPQTSLCPLQTQPSGPKIPSNLTWPTPPQ